MNGIFVVEAILLPHVAMVLSKQHHHVIEKLPVLLPGQATQGAEENETSGFCSGVATAQMRFCYGSITPYIQRLSRQGFLQASASQQD